MCKKLFSLLICFACLMICSCGGSGGGGETFVSPFNGTFIGEITTEGEEKTVETIHLSLKAGSPLSGTFYNKSNGDIGTISGEVVDDVATFTGSIDGDCSTSCDGTITLNSDSVLIEMGGFNCDGLFSSFGELNRSQCVNLAGTWCVTEDVGITCDFGGDIEDWDQSGSVLIVISQNKDSCSVRYDVPDYGVSLSREGRISGNNVSFSGKFLVTSDDNNINFSKNNVTIEGDIINEDKISLSGLGIGSGTYYDGMEFSCTGNATAIFGRKYDLAVAIIRGGSSSFGSIDNFFEGNRWLEVIRQQCENDNRVIAKVFSSNSSSSDVGEWLYGLNIECDGYNEYNFIPAILVGHSWGAHTALSVWYFNVCSRILLDYWDADQWYGLSDETIFNQRHLEPKVVSVDGRIINYLAESPSDILGLYPLLGRKLQEGDDIENVGPVEGTTHTSIVEAVAETGVFEDEINRCLND
jgi:hypothetical protein